MRLPRGLPGSGGGQLSTGLPGTSDAATAAAIAAVAVISGALAVRSMQAATSLALLVMLLAIHGQSRRAGLVGLWTIWLLAPGLRRVLALAEGTPGADPLALLPFVATGVLAVIELRRSTMTRSARITVQVAAAGFLIGAPMGLFGDPQAFGFAMVAYLAGLSAFVLGWGDGREGGLTLVRVLVVALPPLAVYGILQYFFPLPAWDSSWLDTVNLGSIGAPESDHIRVFSTLNSPGTFSLVLAIGILLGLGARRPASAIVPTTAILVLALALTFVRSAWLALTLGLIVFVAASRGRTAGKVVGVIAVCLVALTVVGGSNSTTKAFTQRVTSLGELNEDVSAQDRLRSSRELLPTAIGQPVGAGVGKAGLAVRLGDSESNDFIETIDNGYLAILYQVGLVGFLLIVTAMGRSVFAATRALRTPGSRVPRGAIAAVLASLVALLVAHAANDMLYGITGVIFWYLAGVAHANEPRGEPGTRKGVRRTPE